MTWTNRVIWQEGMFLRAQHFQQQDRWLEALLRGRTAALRPYGWGLTEAVINRDLLATGQFALASATGVFEDGTPFSFPGETDQPVPLELAETTRNALVYLVLPIRQAGAVEIAADDRPGGRYGQQGFEAYDTHSGSPQPAEIQVGRLTPALHAGDPEPRRLSRHRPRADHRSRCRPAGDAGRPLDRAGLAVFRHTAAGRAAGRTGRHAEPARRGAGGPADRAGRARGGRGRDFLLLQSVNRWQKLLATGPMPATSTPRTCTPPWCRWSASSPPSPDHPPPEPTIRPYRHEDLQRSFAPVVADLRRALSAVLETTAVVDSACRTAATACASAP